MKYIIYNFLLLLSLSISFISKGQVQPRQGNPSTVNDYRFVTNITELKKVYPVDGQLVRTMCYSLPQYAGMSLYKFILASSATTNDRDIITSNTTGVGRWVLQIENGTIYAPAFGIIADGTTNNTTALRALFDYTGASKVHGILPMGTIVSDSIYINNDDTWIKGVDKYKTILKIKTYSTVSRSFIVRYDIATVLRRLTIGNLTIDGNTIYTKPTISGSSPVLNDSLQVLLSLGYVDSVFLPDLVYQNGGSLSALFLSHASNVELSNSIWRSIGGICISTFYDSTNYNITIKDFYATSFGLRFKWDLAAKVSPNRRNGDVFLEGGGYNWDIGPGIALNTADTRWFFTEDHFKHNVSFHDIQLDGNGRECFGFSVGGISNARHGYNINFDNITSRNIFCGPSKAIDTVSGREADYGSNMWELTYMDSTNFHKLKLRNQFLQISLCKAITVDYSILICDSIKNQNTGDKTVLRIGTYGGSTDTTSDVTVDHSNFTIGDGVWFNMAGSEVDYNITLSNNQIHYLRNKGGHYIGILNKPSNSRHHYKIRLENNTFDGAPASDFGPEYFVDLNSNAPNLPTLYLINNHYEGIGLSSTAITNFTGFSMGNQLFRNTYINGVTDTSTFTGLINPYKIVSQGSAPSIAALAGAGGSPTISVSGTDVSGTVSLTTGSSPSSTASIFTVTYSSAYLVKPRVILIPANAATQALANNTWYISDGSSDASSFTINAGTAALTATTAYMWYYHVIQ